MSDLFVHPHALTHGLAEEEIRYAWSNYIASQQREAPREEHCVRIGYGAKTPTAIQMIGVVKPHGTLAIHAMTPSQASILDEVGIPRRKL